MQNDISGRRTRPPWRETVASGSPLTVPVFMAYCSIAAALRPWTRTSGKTIVTLDAQEDYCRDVHLRAAEFFANAIWKTADWERYVFEWSLKSSRDQMQAEKNQMAIFSHLPATCLQTMTNCFRMRLSSCNRAHRGKQRRHYGEQAFRSMKMVSRFFCPNLGSR